MHTSRVYLSRCATIFLSVFSWRASKRERREGEIKREKERKEKSNERVEESNFILVKLSLPLFLTLGTTRLHVGTFLFFFSFISAARMHARFNNAGSSMRSQRVVSFLTSTEAHSPSSSLVLLFSLLAYFILHALTVHTYSVVHRICISERAHLRFSLRHGNWETCLLTRAAYSYGNPVSCGNLEPENVYTCGFLRCARPQELYNFFSWFLFYLKRNKKCFSMHDCF